MPLIMKSHLATKQEYPEDSPIQKEHDILCRDAEYAWAMVKSLINERKRLIDTGGEEIANYLDFNQKIEEARQAALAAEQVLEQMEDDNPELERPHFLFIPPEDSFLRCINKHPLKGI